MRPTAPAAQPPSWTGVLGGVALVTALSASTHGCTGDVDKQVDTDLPTDVETDTAPTDVETDTGEPPPVDTYDYAAPPEMVALEPGTFTMGTPETEVGATPLEPEREVTITYGFEIGRYEVMQGQFRERMGYEPSYWGDCDRCPVETLNWHEAVAFSVQLSQDEGLTPCYVCQGELADVRCMPDVLPLYCDGYRLPTEAEWEYAARSGGTVSGSTPSGGSLTDADDLRVCDAAVTLSDGSELGEQAWYCGNSDATPGNTSRPVGQLPANAAGLHDVIGNVWEFCTDWYVDFPDTAPSTDPTGPYEGEYRVVKGGGWNAYPREVRIGFRSSSFPLNRNDNLGFRVARTLDTQEPPPEAP